METLERKISSYLCRWLSLLRSLSSAVLYGRSNKLQLPISSLDEEFRVSHTREALLYWDFKDSRVAATGIMMQIGRKWRARGGLERAESLLKHRALVGMLATGTL